MDSGGTTETPALTELLGRDFFETEMSAEGLSSLRPLLKREDIASALRLFRSEKLLDEQEVAAGLDGLSALFEAATKAERLSNLSRFKKKAAAALVRQAEFQASQGRPIQRRLLKEAIRWDRFSAIRILRTRGIRKARRLAAAAVSVGREAPVILYTVAKRSPSLLIRYKFPSSAERLLEPFREEGPLREENYDGLFRYFATGWRTYRTRGGEGATYPGYRSWSGEQVDRLEGFSRMMPLFASWCASGRETEVTLPGGGAMSLPAEFERGIATGTDPSSPHYWGDMPGTSNQRIVEAADIALALWLFRDSVWPALGARRQAQVLDWLALAKGRPGLDNNWHLFFVLIDRVLASFGRAGCIPDARQRFKRIKEFHLGDGWFVDGPGGRVDFYSAWGFHYALSWIQRIDSDWDPEFIASCQEKFLSGYKHLIGPEGIPILGRSVCYRMAAPSPLVFGHETHPHVVSTGEARRALDCVWRYFIRRGAVRDGVATQGYFGPDPRILDPYSGPASPLWSLRSLVAAFSFQRGKALWAAVPEPLPVERGDFEIDLFGPGWRVWGEGASVNVEIPGNPADSAPALEPCPVSRRLRWVASRDPGRPRNTEAKYQSRHYKSDQPFCA